MQRKPRLAATAAALVLAAVGVTNASASTTSSGGFESFGTGDVDGQHGWTKTGAYDVAVVDPEDHDVTDMGTRALRLSNATVSGSFGDQTFSAPLADEAGETLATSDGMSGGTRQSAFTATFSLRTTTEDHQEGLYTSISPDRGDGARMSYLRLEDRADGVHVFFDDYSSGGFREEDVATLDRAAKHTIGLTMRFVDGVSNDVVNVYVDGSLVHTGTSWEDYFREVEGNASRTVDSLLFREGGNPDSDARPGLVGGGFLVDDLVMTSGPATCLFTDDGSTMTLQNDCTTDHTIYLPDGYTLDGDDHTITAVDPAGGHFVGAVVQNAGHEASVTNLGVSADVASVCDSGADRLAGIRLDGAGGAISGNDVSGLEQGPSGDGCQEGNAIEVRNPSTATMTTVGITGNTVADYQKTGILVSGPIRATVTGNEIEGYGPVGFIAQNGVQVSFGASAIVSGNSVSDNWYTGSGTISCGVLLYDADGVKLNKNAYAGNQRDVCNFGKGGGKVNPA
jgi:hypothetical protein